MSFVGKILVVVQLVLSICFMAFAGAVYSAQMNWREDARKQKAALQKKDGEFRDVTNQMETLKTDLTAKITAADQKAQQVEAVLKGREQDVARLTKELADAQVARKTASEQSLISGRESSSRKVEADNQRGINHNLTEQLESEFAERVKLEDQLRSKEVALESATKKNKDLLSRLALMQQALQAAGITADVTQLAQKDNPPPPVDALVMEMLPAKKQGGTELIEISLGSDDGLKRGHEMTVYRSGLQGNQRPRFLARIRLVSVTPDRAVGQVIESSRNGVIQKGDNVTTKL